MIEYCKCHKDDEPTDEEMDKFEPITGWDADFVRVDMDTLFDIMLAANFLDIEKMLDLTCKAVAEMIKGKKPEENSGVIFALKAPRPPPKA